MVAAEGTGGILHDGLPYRLMPSPAACIFPGPVCMDAVEMQGGKDINGRKRAELHKMK